MAGKIPAGKIVTDIDLDNIKAVKSLRELRQAVSSATSAWKAQQAELRSAGQSTEAAVAKYKGLSDAIGKQKTLVEKLQSELKRYTQVQREADTRTKEGKHDYENASEALKKTETQLNRATTRLASLTSQQERAKKSMDYYKSGLAEAQQKLKVSSEVTRSYVERLKSEGKEYDALKTKQEGYKSAVANLTKQQKIQEQELRKIASESGKSSQVYQRQEVRVNKTAASINRLNQKIKASQSEINRLKPTGFNRIANGMKKVTTASDKMKSGIHKAWDGIKTGATTAAAGIAAVGAAAVSGAKKSADLQQSYKEINNLLITGGEHQAEVTKNVAKMQKEGRDMSIEYGKSQQEIAEGYEDLVKRGYTSAQALGAMRTELQGSVASGDKFADVVKVSSQTLESFGMKADTTAEMTSNTKRVVNELAYAADMTSTGFSDLGVGMSYVGSTAHQMGFSLSETASAMGILSNNGLEADKAGTGLRKVLNSLNSAIGNINSKKSPLKALGIKKSDLMDSKGELKSISTIMGVLGDHMKGLSKADKVDIMNSLFGTTGQQAGLILAENAKDLDKLSAKTLKAGKSGKYVSELASKNSQTAKVQMDRFKQTMNAFTMDLGSAFLPAINEAGNKMAKFLTSKDGQKFQKNVADVVGKFANALVGFIEWASKHTGTMKAIGVALAAGFGVVKFAKLVQQINATRLALKELGLAGKFSTHLTNGWDKMLIRLSNGKTRAGKILKGLGKAFKATGRGITFAAKEMGKAFLKQIKLLGQGIKGIGSGLLKAAKAVGKEAASAGRFLGRQVKAGFTKSVDFSKGLFGKGNGAGKLTGLMQSAHSAGGFKNLTTAGKVGTVAAGAGVAVDTATSIVKAIKDKAGSRKQYEDIGTAAGKGIGGAIGLWFGGPAGAAVGSMIGGKVGKWAGDAAKNFQNGWNAKKPPKNFWSLENMGYSAHNMWNGFTKGVSNTINWFKKNWKEIGVYLISPLAGAINSLYKHNKKFHKWVDNLVKGFKNAWKGIAKWFSNLGKSIQKSWKGMTKWFSKLGKNMVKGLKNAWKGIAKWFSNLGKSVQKSWKGMTKWFTKLGKNMVKGVKSSWKHITKFFSSLVKGIKKVWNVLTGWFKKVARAEVRGVKVVWKGITSFFSSIAKGVKKAWNILTGWFKRIAQMEIRGYKVIWKTITSWFAGIVKGVQKAWSGMTSFFGRIGKNTVGALKGAWKGVTSWFSDLLDGIKKTFDNVFGPIAKTIGKISDSLGKVGDNIGKVFSGDWGDIHFATGTDWKSRRPIPAILNDGQDSPETNNRESIIHANGSWELLPNIPNLKRTLLPGEDVINARDTAKLLKRNVVHFANGTVTLNNHHEKELVTLTRKQYELLKDNAEKRKKKYEEDKKRHDENKKRKEKKDKNPHKGQTLVDKGLLTGASHRVGQAVWISNAVFKRLTTAPKVVRTARKTRRKRKSSTRRKSTSSTRRRSSSSRRRSSTRRRTTSRTSITRRSAVVSATVKGGKALTELAKLLKYIAGTHHATVAITKPRGTKNLEGLSKAFKKVSGSHKASFKVTYSGTYKAKKSIDRLLESIGKLKSKKYKTVSLKVKYSGTYKAKLSFDRLSKSIKSTSSRFKSIKSSSNSAGKALKSLGSRVTSVHSRVNSLFKALKKEKFGDAIKKQAEEAVKSLKGKGNFAKQFDSMVKKFKKDLASMVNNSKKEFKTMWNNIEKTSSTGQHKVISDLSSFSTKFKHGWNNLNSGVESSYSHFWSHMKSKARSGLNDVIGVLNSGISKIDTVVGEFGGNKNAVHKVSKLATGTGALGGVRREITSPTLAILNDGNDSPETQNKETIWDTNTGKFGVVQGRNVPFLLHPGQEVLNASESRMLGFTHFATGTGALKQLYELAKKNWKNPSKTGKANFGKVTGLKGAINSLSQGMQKEAQGQALEWWEQLWTMVESKVNDDDLGPATGLLKEVEKLGKGKKYVLGTWGPSTYDCSGLVSRAIQNLYHKGWGRMNVAGLWTHATEISRSKAKPGDPVFWLPNDHVGIYIGGDKYWSAFSPNAHPDIGIHSIKTSVPGVKPTFGRFKGISNSNSNSDKDEKVKVKTSNALQKFIEPQVGPGFWKTIKKIADKYGDQGGLLGAFKLGATETARVKALAKALKKADPKATEHGIAAVIGNSIAESSLNPAIVNEIGATGLWQFAFGRAAALRSYANKHNMSWKNPAAQINYALNADSSSGLFKEILEGHGSVASLAGRFSREYEVGGHDDAHIKGGLTAAKILGYANGGIANKPSIFGEAGPEMAIPLIPGKSTRAYELLGKTATILAGQSGLNQQAQVQTQEDRKEEHEFMKSVLLLLQQIAGKDGSIDMKVTTPEGRALWEVVKPFSKADQRADEIKRRKGLSGRF